MENEIPNAADAVMLNPKFLEKLKEESSAQDNELPQYLKDHLKELEESPSYGIDNEVLKYLVDYLNDPMNSSKYRDYVLFGGHNKMDFKDEEEPQKGWSVFIPIYSTTF